MAELAVNGRLYGAAYLQGCDTKLKWIDKQFGNRDGKVSTEEMKADFQRLHNGILNAQDYAMKKEPACRAQAAQDKSDLNSAYSKIPKLIEKYAGADKVFSGQECANLINSKEWNAYLNVWHNSVGDANIEMEWIDSAHIKDGRTTKGEVKVGLFNSIAKDAPKLANKLMSKIDNLVEKYVGDDGVFSIKEYMQMKNDPEYKQMELKTGMYPWFEDDEK